MQAAKRILLITGPPGIGKTTVLTKTVSLLRERGFSVGGMLSREIRENGVRVGFEILDVGSQKCGWLARVDQPEGPRMGKYRVNLQDLEVIGAKAITDATEKCNVVAIDEVGPMELYSEKFKEAVNTALESGKIVIAIVHWKADDKLISNLKARTDAETFTVTNENRERIAETITERAKQR